MARKLSRMQQKAMFAKQNKRTRFFTLYFIKPADAKERRQIIINRALGLPGTFSGGDFKDFKSKKKRDMMAKQLKKQKFIISKGTEVKDAADIEQDKRIAKLLR